jgi:hypothetical protein
MFNMKPDLAAAEKPRHVMRLDFQPLRQQLSAQPFLELFIVHISH